MSVIKTDLLHKIITEKKDNVLISMSRTHTNDLLDKTKEVNKES